MIIHQLRYHFHFLKDFHHKKNCLWLLIFFNFDIPYSSYNLLNFHLNLINLPRDFYFAITALKFIFYSLYYQFLPLLWHLYLYLIKLYAILDHNFILLITIIKKSKITIIIICFLLEFYFPSIQSFCFYVCKGN